MSISHFPNEETSSYADRFSTPDRRVGEALGRVVVSVSNDCAQPPESESPLAALLMHCERTSLAWPVRLTTMDSDVYRRGGVLAGPLFTSAAYPWPDRDERWLEPVLQVDLAVLGNLRCLSLGEGWLQVWMSPFGGVTRIVPASEIADAPLAALPSTRVEDYHQRLVECGDGSVGWLPGCAIVGIEAPFVDYGHNELLHYVDQLLEDEQVTPPAIIDSMRALKAAIDADEDWLRLGHRAFGMINESELEAYALPPVLFVLEEGAPLRSSGNGTDGVYVCYEREADGAVTFSVQGAYL